MVGPFMIRFFLTVVVLASYSMPTLVFAQASDAQKTDDAQKIKKAYQFLDDSSRDFRLSLVGQPKTVISQTKKPLLKWTNPIRNHFSVAAIRFWTLDERPIAATTFAVRGTGRFWVEFTSFSNKQLSCEQKNVDQPIWNPTTANIPTTPLNGAPKPSSNKTFRLAQMQKMSKRFEVRMAEVDKPEIHKMLRRLSKPLYRWSGGRVLDGAVFSFGEGTDPEAVVLIEIQSNVKNATAAKSTDSKPTWHYTFARMTSRPLEVRLDSKTIKRVSAYWKNPRMKTDPYTEIPVGDFPSGNN